MRRITITVGDISATAILHDSPTAEAIWAALPITGRANRWGDEIYFEIPIQMPQAEDARDVVTAGELGYWPVGRAFCIFWGPTPASRGTEIRAYSPVNVFGRVEREPLVFDGVASGARIQVEAVA